MEQALNEEIVMPLIETVEQQKGTKAATELDEYGFMLHPEKWSKKVAQLLAQEEAIGDLNEDHWRVIYYLRQYYSEFGIVPPVRMLERGSGFSLRHIYELFPNGLLKGVCRVAGMHSGVAMPYSLACSSR